MRCSFDMDLEKMNDGKKDLKSQASSNTKGHQLRIEAKSGDIPLPKDLQPQTEEKQQPDHESERAKNKSYPMSKIIELEPRGFQRGEERSRASEVISGGLDQISMSDITGARSKLENSKCQEPERKEASKGQKSKTEQNSTPAYVSQLSKDLESMSEEETQESSNDSITSQDLNRYTSKHPTKREPTSKLYLASIAEQNLKPVNPERSKKFSHPGCMSPLSPLSGSPINVSAIKPLSSSPSFSPPWSPKLTKHFKKHSLPSASRPVPILSLNGGNQTGDDITKELEAVVRKISRGSPNRFDFGNRTSPSRLPNSSANRFSNLPYLTDLTLNTSRMGLSGLARGYEQYCESLMALRPATEFGEASSDDLSSEWESCSESELSPVGITFNMFMRPPRSEFVSSNPFPCGGPRAPQTDSDESNPENMSPKVKTMPPKRPSGWRKLRSMVQWTPFVQTFKNRRYQWVQLAGHSGNFKAGKNQGTVLKKLCPQEEHCYKQFHNDALSPYVPEYQGTLIIDDEKFIQLQDCLSSFNLPSIMDCKIGVRTYLEEELAKAKEKPKLRKDMYEKMIAVDHSAPTEEEHRLKGVTKPRYMVWRETISSTATLGFRIEGVKKNDGTSSKEFKTTKTKEQILESFRNFISGSAETAKQYLERLITIRHALDGSEFFRTHELIGSSLLFVHDNCKSNIWLIDFGKTVPVPENTHIDHKSPWEVGNHEDGYLIGIQNLIALYSELVIVLEKEALDHLHAKRIPIES